MGNRVCDQKGREYFDAEQNHKTCESRGYIGDRSTSLIELIGIERVCRQSFRYEGTYYVTEDGETYDKKYVDTHKPQRTGVNFYEVSNWIYNEGKKVYEPIIRRIVMIKNTNTQLSLDL